MASVLVFIFGTIGLAVVGILIGDWAAGSVVWLHYRRKKPFLSQRHFVRLVSLVRVFGFLVVFVPGVLMLVWGVCLLLAE